jgi:hypothetical protein
MIEQFIAQCSINLAVARHNPIAVEWDAEQCLRDAVDHHVGWTGVKGDHIA